MICGVNDMMTARACNLAKATRDKGADGILVAAAGWMKMRITWVTNK